MNLYEINDKLSKLLQSTEFDEETGELLPEFEEKLATLKLVKEEKVLHCARAIKNLTADADALKNEINALTARRKRTERTIEAIRNYLSSTIPGEKYSDSTAEIGWRKSVTVNVTDEAIIPHEFCRHIPERFEADKICIKNAIGSGMKINGCELVEKLNLQVK
jgi:hypothetical protein